MPVDRHTFRGAISAAIYFGRDVHIFGGSVVHPFHDKIPIGEITNASFV